MIGCRVVADQPEVMAVVQSQGSPVVRRVGRRGGPNGRTLLPDTWDGAREERRWDGPPVVRLHPVGRGYSVIRTWLDDEGRFDGWYVNLEQPWTRTAAGFDSRDDVLDVTVSDDLASWALKDEDELDFAVEIGTLTAADTESIRVNAAAAIDDVASRRWPFVDDGWEAFAPRSHLTPVELPAGWADG